MSTAEPPRPTVPADVAFAGRLKRLAAKSLEPLFPAGKWQTAAQRVVMAFIDAVKRAKKPDDYFSCTDASIAVAMATSASTGLYPGGPNPQVYLVPMRPRQGAPMELNWWISHRGLTRLAYLAGFGVRAIPVCNDDVVRIEFGEVIELSPANEDFWPTSLADLRGFCVVARDIGRDRIAFRSWIPMSLIEKRRQMSRQKDSGPWAEWPIEMAAKAAIKYVFARGEIPIESTALETAIEAESRGEVVHTTSEGVEVLRPRARSSAPPPAHLQTDPPVAPQLTDEGAKDDPFKELHDLQGQERVPVTREPGDDRDDDGPPSM